MSFYKKWQSLDFDFFLKLLMLDPKAKKDYYSIFWQSKRPPFSIIQDWGHDTHKIRFIVPEWVLRNVDQSLELNIWEWHIHHSERECRAIWPEIEFHKELKFFSYPLWFYNHTFDKYFYLTNEEKRLLNNNNWYWINTDLEEDDVVMWRWNEILSESLNHLVENIKKYNLKTLRFNCCCVPRIVWDDIQSILQNVKSKIDIPFIFDWQLEKTPFEQKILLLEDYISKIDINNIQKEKNTISLFGYHENEYLKYIYDILVNNGIKLNTVLIPSIDVELLPKLFKTELFIFSNNKFQEEVFEYPFKNLGMDYISPVYPYSVNNTNIWLWEISKYFWLNF